MGDPRFTLPWGRTPCLFSFLRAFDGPSPWKLLILEGGSRTVKGVPPTKTRTGQKQWTFPSGRVATDHLPVSVLELGCPVRQPRTALPGRDYHFVKVAEMS